MSAEGSIELALHWNGSIVDRVAIRSSRPLAASQLLEAKTPAAAESLVPMLFTLCGRAQTVAAAGAVEAAQACPPAPAVARRRELLVAAECIHEYLWRVALDWPALHGEAADVSQFAVIRRSLQSVLGRTGLRPRWWHSAWDDAMADEWRSAAADVTAFLTQKVYGMAPGDWLELQTLSEFERWLGAAATQPARLLRLIWHAPSSGSSASARLPWLGTAALAREIAPRVARDPRFARAPEWGGRPAETGALARNEDEALVRAALSDRGNSVAVRLLARLHELAQLTQRIDKLLRGEPLAAWIRPVDAGLGAGCCAVETARGMLLHYVEIAAGRITRYRIVAPTEWNFHPQGAFAAGMQGYAAGGAAQIERAARLLAHALDPCVSYEVKLAHA